MSECRSKIKEIRGLKRMLEKKEEMQRTYETLKKLLDDYKQTFDAKQLLQKIDNDKKLIDVIKQHLIKIVKCDISKISEYVDLFDNFKIQKPVVELLQDVLLSIELQINELERKIIDKFLNIGISIVDRVIHDIDYWAWNVSPTTPCETYHSYNCISLLEAAEQFATDCKYSSYITRPSDVKILELMPEEVYEKFEEEYHNWLEDIIKKLCKEV